MLMHMSYVMIKSKYIFLSTTMICSPTRNRTHISNSCHINAVIVLLSSLPLFVDNVQEKFLYDELVNYELSTKHFLHFCRIYNLSYTELMDANDSLKRILYKSNVSKNILLYLDCTDDLLNIEDRKLSFSDLIVKYRPLYLLINVQDFQVVTNNTDIHYKFSVLINDTPAVAYSMRGVVLYNDLHYTTLIDKYLYNDLLSNVIHTNNAEGYPSIYLYIRNN